MIYPREANSREAMREHYRGEEVHTALQLAARRGRSSKCGGVGYDQPRHAQHPYGCRNDGTSCLCHCHDRSGGGQ